MRSLLAALLAGVLAASTSSAAVAPVPESEQGALVLKIIGDYEAGAPASPHRLVRVVYFTPADRDPVADYEHRLEAIFEDLRSFYHDEMNRHGFGPKTFELEHDAQHKFLVHLVKGKQPARVYIDQWKERRGLIGGECEEALATEHLGFTNETIALVCNLADWNPQTHQFNHPSPYSGTWDRKGGLCWLMDSPILNLDSLGLKEPVVQDAQYGKVPLGRRNAMFIGSIGHELGHALGLPHSRERWDEKARGKSLMGAGNLQYRLPGEGAFLTMASAMRLAARPIVSESDKGFGEVPQLEECTLRLSTNVTRAELVGRPAAFRLEGTVKGSPPVYGVIAYFDSLHDGGYESPTATAVPDAQGRFALELSDLEPCTNGGLFISFCHANGTTSARSRKFSAPAVPGHEGAQAATRSALKAFRDLLKQHRVPGFEHLHGHGQMGARPGGSSERVEVTFKVDGDEQPYDFTMRRDPETGSWEIQKTQKTEEE